MKQDEKPLQPERLEKIKGLLEEKKTVKVTELSKICDVSENTIRRDLIALEDMGYCYRAKGGATLLERTADRTPFSSRVAIHKDGKNLIAKKAAGYIESGTTVIIDSGTTAAELAEEIIDKKHITVITPSMAVANILAGIPEITLVMPGGILNPFSRSLTGLPAEEFFSRMHADILFLAVKGVSLQTGISDHTIIEAAVKKQMIKAADKVIVLADHSKLDKKAFSLICPLKQIDVLITDHLADPEFINGLKSQGISVV